MKEKIPTKRIRNPLLEAVNTITDSNNMIIDKLNSFTNNPFFSIAMKIKMGIDWAIILAVTFGSISPYENLIIPQPFSTSKNP